MSAPRAITRRQREALDALTAFVAEHGRSPALKELGQALGGLTDPAVSALVRKLADAGYVRRRGWKIDVLHAPGMISIEVAAKAIASLTASSSWAVVELRRHGYHGLADEVERVGAA